MSPLAASSVARATVSVAVTATVSSRRQRRSAAARTSAISFLAVALGCLLPSCESLRSSNDKGKQGDAPVQAAEYEVHLLVARHGLSCTNVVEKWVHKWDFGRGRIADPLLSGAGEHASDNASHAVASWLAEQKYQVDAVLSSELLRAQQTAVLTWPEADPLYIAPFIRETASGSSNFPKKQRDQIHDLKQVIGSRLRVNYEWVNLYGMDVGTTSGDWDKFLNFLEQSFLPDLIKRTWKPSGSRIVLGIVSHSLLMRDSTIGDECSQHWKKHGVKKPLNNQVLHLQYSFSTAPQPHRPEIDVTPIFNLQRTKDACGEVAPGLLLKDEQTDKKIGKLCLSDIGYSCIEPIARYSLKPDWLWGVTNEKHVIDSAKDLQKQKDKLAKTDMDLKATQKAWALSSADPEREDPGNRVRFRTDSVAEAVVNASYGALANERDIEGVQRFRKEFLLGTKEKLTRQSAAEQKEVEKLEGDLADQLAEECWTGGMPDPLAFAKVFNKPLTKDVVALVKSR